MSEENQTPEQQPAESAHPAPEGADEPTVQAPVRGEVPPAEAVPPPGAVPSPGAVPPAGAVPPPGDVPSPGAVPLAGAVPASQGYYYPPGVAMPRPPGGFGRFVRHRATQIVAAAVLGLLVGGGTIALVDNASGGPGAGHHHYIGNYGSGHGNFGPGQGFREIPNGN